MDWAVEAPHLDYTFVCGGGGEVGEDPGVLQEGLMVASAWYLDSGPVPLPSPSLHLPVQQGEPLHLVVTDGPPPHLSNTQYL